ncbi:glyoxylate/hydroxypyruvate reductase A [Albidovulum inexpectatum]|uniref:Glyoxylate/hydroxypyruvate reductase A n=1 Tax=Albidovulum inexpectatum TaxID=196587 RepID=A0A2S5JL37_9RHOB|nr:glyoxylate/hydroxypyruvate reductase A [Albidovulum inexpectatum]PPB82108.1 glyoxylate/hydroxypyruvate reductase A [Albidovulum inexpectatum]
MRPTVLFAGRPDDWPVYAPALRAALKAAELDAELVHHADDPARVDYIVFDPNGPITDFSPFVRCKAVLNLWAGVERIVTNPTLSQPLCRMVDDGLRQGMVEYCVAHCLRHHLDIDRHVLNQDGVWRGSDLPPLATERTIGILGLGQLGAAVGQALAGLGFDVAGWSQSPKDIAGIACASGPEGLNQVLGRAEILILLLPLTDRTRHILNARTLDLLPRGAVVINPGRGALIDDTALLEALGNGRLRHATLDVFTTEPLPPDHPFWAHPQVTVTPHIAAVTRPESAARVIAENIRRGERGEPFLHVVDRARGY